MTADALTQLTPDPPEAAPVAWANRIVGYAVVNPADLLANPANWRHHPGRQRVLLRAVMGAIGWVAPAIANIQTGHLVDGHMRLEEALDAGVTEVPVVFIDVDEPTERSILRTLDPLGALAVPDRDRVAELMPDATNGDERLQQLFARVARSVGLLLPSPSTAAANRPAARYEEAQQLAAAWAVELGQVWDIPSVTAPAGCHRLTVGDSTDPAVVAQMLGGDRARLVYTDPPWGVNYLGGYRFREVDIEGDGDPRLYAPILAALTPHVDDDTPLYLWYGVVLSEPVFAAVRGAGWSVRTAIDWVKHSAQYGAIRAHYKEQKETALYCYRRGHAPAWYGPANEVNVWYADRAQINRHHPTQKPPELAARAMTNSSQKGERVVDPCIGGGATLVAGELMGRFVSGGDLDPAYIAVTLQRAVDDLGLSPRRVYPA